MPKRTPDLDDARGNMAGQGGPQDGPIDRDENDRRHQQHDGDLLETGGVGGGELGQGGQRHAGGSSRDGGKQA